MAKTYESYIWSLAAEHLTAQELEECANNALASIPSWQADEIRAMMREAEKNITNFGEMSSAEFFVRWAIFEVGRE